MPPRSGVTLSRAFYARPVEVVARELLGCRLVRIVDGRRVGGRIVETEAYGGPGDPGSHADRSPTGRASIMFGRPGIAYVYFTYGMHHCLNAVTGPVGVGSAVLIRSLEPLEGVDRMRATAPKLPDAKLAAGPGRLCRALGIDRSLNGSDLVRGPLRIVSDDAAVSVLEGLRIGLSSDDARPWRFWVPSPSVSVRAGAQWAAEGTI